jgi:hypothetical protein
MKTSAIAILLAAILQTLAPAPQRAVGATIYCVSTNPAGLVACPAGVPGPAGPQGPTGIQGPVGPTGPTVTLASLLALLPTTPIANLAAAQPLALYVTFDQVNAIPVCVATVAAPGCPGTATAAAVAVNNADGTQSWQYAYSRASQFTDSNGNPLYPGGGNIALWQTITPVSSGQ